jgi:hypothetical protein
MVIFSLKEISGYYQDFNHSRNLHVVSHLKTIMRYLLSVSLLFISFELSAQSSGKRQKEVLYLTKSNGDTIEIITQTKSNLNDTALLTVNSIRNKKRTRLQQFKTLVTFPLEVKATSFANKKGILITYDPTGKWGNAFLYLFNETKNRFQEIKGVRELGVIKPVIGKNHQLFYSYISCGCADDCWVSKLFTVKEFKMKILSELSCDCSKLIVTHSKAAVTSSCEAYNNDQKFESIAKYWRTAIKNGL